MYFRGADFIGTTLFNGEMAERLKAHAWKVCIGNPYLGFESLSLRLNRRCRNRRGFELQGYMIRQQREYLQQLREESLRGY